MKGSGTVLKWIKTCMKRDAICNHANRISNPEGPWPEVVGLSKELAKELIERDTGGNVEVMCLGPDQFMTCDFRLDRVVISYDDDGKVSREPSKG